MIPPGALVRRFYHPTSEGCDVHLIRYRSTTLQGEHCATFAETLTVADREPVEFHPNGDDGNSGTDGPDGLFSWVLLYGCCPLWAQPDRWEAIDDLGYGGG